MNTDGLKSLLVTLEGGTVKKLGQGRSAEVFDLGGGHILKLFFPDSKEKFQVELEKNRLIQGIDFPKAQVKKVVHLNGRDGIVFSGAVLGPTISQIITHAPWRLAEMARALADVQAQMHRCQAPKLPCFKHYLKTSLSAEKAFGHSICTYLTDQIDHCPEGDILCHGDLHLDNVIVGPEGAFVVDWSRACKGDALLDVSKTISCLKLEKIQDSALFRWLKKPFRNLFIQIYVARYEKITGIDTSSIKAFIEPVEAELLLKKGSLFRSRIIHEINEKYKTKSINERIK